MVDKIRRRKLAFHLRRLAVGLISNDDFEDAIMEDISSGNLPQYYSHTINLKQEDLIIKPMLELSWCLYNDVEEHHLTGPDKLSDEALKEISRCILFLHSDLEYQWPYFDIINPFLRFFWKDWLLGAVTFGKHYCNQDKKLRKEFDQFRKTGDYDIWPFTNRKQYETQLLQPPFLAGNKNITA